MKDLDLSDGVAEKSYSNAWGTSTIKVEAGEPLLILNGTLANADAARPELDLWAEGYDTDGSIVTRTVDTAHIMGHIGLHVETDETRSFTMHLAAAEGLRFLRLHVRAYEQTPP